MLNGTNGAGQLPELPLPPSRRKLRWLGAAIGVVSAIGDTMGLIWVGVPLKSGGYDFTLIVAGWLGVSFALLGFLLGKLIEDQARERAATELISAQMLALEQSRIQLVQSEKLAALGQLAAAIAHEVRNPLAVIRSAAQSLGDSVPGEQARRASSFITEETDRLSRLVNSLLAFARPVQLVREPVAIDEVIDRAVLLAEDKIAAKGVRLRRKLDAGLSAANADPTLLAQVIAGLLDNGADAVAPGGEILIEARPMAGNLEISVADSGAGIPAELRDRVFEPFFTTRATGAGLGLAIARQVIEAHGGKIVVGDSPIGGARFVITIPSADAVRVAV